MPVSLFTLSHCAWRLLPADKTGLHSDIGLKVRCRFFEGMTRKSVADICPDGSLMDIAGAIIHEALK